MTDTVITSRWGPIDDIRARRDAVRLPSRRAVGGIASLPEILSSYGIYIFFAAVALAGGVVILNAVLASSTVNEYGTVVQAVQSLYRNERGSNKFGLVTATIADSGRLPDKLVEGSDIWVGGGDYPVRLLAGSTAVSTNHDKLKLNGLRYFSVLIGDENNPVPAALCSDIVFAPYVGRVGLAILDGEAQTSPTLETFVGTPGVASHWSVRHSDSAVESLEDITPEDVEDACTAADDTQIMMVFR